MSEEMITIKREEYDKLVKDSDWLNCLNNAGVDNWDGCEYAYEEFEEMYPEDD